MAHEGIEPGRAVLYNLPALNLPTPYSDALRSLEFNRFFAGYRGPRFTVCTGDGWSWPLPAPHRPEFTARFRSRSDLDAVIRSDGEALLARSFLNGALEIQGNFFALLAAAEYALLHSEGLSSGLVQTLTRLSSEFAHRLLHMRGSTGPRNWRCVPCPVDLPPGFFEQWLGPLRAHCCASFHSPQEDLGPAENRALDRACALLELHRSDRFLEIGCGWGSLLVHAARRYGVEARGIASSETQAAAARAHIYRCGLDHVCRIETRDLRTAPYPAESLDKIADIGIFEQVSSSEFDRYVKSLQRMLAPGGLLLLHRMTPVRSGHSLVRSVHPGLPHEPLSKELALAESAGWELVDVETLDHDYAQTLRAWIARLRQNSDAGRARVFSHSYRAWLLYLLEIAASLQAQELQVHRILMRRPARLRAAA